MGWLATLDELADAIRVPRPAATDHFSAVSTDTRTLAPGTVFFALQGENFDGNAFVAEAFAKGAVAAVCTRAMEGGPCLVVDDTLVALNQFAAHHRAKYDIPVFGLTGSCGKTSAKDYTTAVLGTKYNVMKTQGNLNNEIGCPLTVLRMDDATEFAVVEMGANHVGEIGRMCETAQPTESAITMIGPAHLEGFGSIENVQKAKGEIMEGLHGRGTFYVNTDDPRCVAVGERHGGQVVRFGREGDIALRGAEQREQEFILTVDPVGRLRLPLPSPAHATNALLAIAVGWRHGVEEFEEPLRAAVAGGARFKRYPLGPIQVLDDSYNANPSSMAAALDTLGRHAGGARYAVVGEMLELGPDARDFHRAVGEQAGAAGVSILLARGEHARDTIEAARAAGVHRAEAVENHDDMARIIHEAAREGDALLVKGSRGMRMERVIDALRDLYE